jgi:hypothetical protein
MRESRSVQKFGRRNIGVMAKRANSKPARPNSWTSPHYGVDIFNPFYDGSGQNLGKSGGHRYPFPTRVTRGNTSAQFLKFCELSHFLRTVSFLDSEIVAIVRRST